MATKKISTIQKTADSIKDQVKQVADTAIVVSETLVDGSLVTGERWQKLMAKSLKEGTVLFGKQQDMVLDTLEIARDQYLKGNVRLRKLFGIKAPSFMKAVEGAVEDVVDAVEDVVEDVTKPYAAKVKAIKNTSNAAIEMATATISKVMKGAPAKAKKAAKAVATPKTDEVVKTTKAVAKKAKKVTAKKKAVAKKVVTKKAAPKKVTAKKTTKKVAAKKATTKKVTATDNLTKIEGIGPKIEELLNNAGIRSFKMLGAVDVKTLRTILDNAGPRYKMHNPKTWRTQAKLAAKGNWDKLTTLQKELKGGVKTKK